MRTRRLYALFLLSVFLFGCLAHLLTTPKAVEESLYTLTFESENVNNLLLYDIPGEGESIRFGDGSGTVSGVARTPHTVLGRKDGLLLSSPSLLLSDLTFTVLAYAHEKNGRLFLGDRPLHLGEEIELRGGNFSIYARLTDFRMRF